MGIEPVVGTFTPKPRHRAARVASEGPEAEVRVHGPRGQPDIVETPTLSIERFVVKSAASITISKTIDKSGIGAESMDHWIGADPLDSHLVGLGELAVLK